MTETRSLVETDDDPAIPTLSGGGRITAIVPQDVEQVIRLAGMIEQSGMAPKGMKKPQIVICLMHGAEVGLPPMQAIQSIAVINGRPTIWGDGMLALVRASGLLQDLEEKLEGAKDNLKAICTALRKGQATPIQRSFSVGMAKRAGLWGRDVWAKYPDRMLRMRARSWCLRDGFADVLRGLVAPEEAEDMSGIPTAPRPYDEPEIVAETIDAKPDPAALSEEAVKVARDVATLGTERLKQHMDSLPDDIRAQFDPMRADLEAIAFEVDSQEESK